MPAPKLSISARVILLTQTVAAGVSVVFSIMAAVPMGVHQDDFKGHCILFSTGIWQERDGQFKVRRNSAKSD